MVKYIFGNNTSCLIKFNPETEEVDSVPYMRTNIDWVFEAPEDGIMDDGTKVKKGDIVILFYKREYQKYRYIVINNKQWKANLAAQKKYEEEARLKEKVNESCRECCDACCESGC